MTGKIRPILFLVIMWGFISGCTSGPVFTVEVYGTPTPYAGASDLGTATSYVPPDVPANGSPEAPIPTLAAFTKAPAAMPSDFSPILYGEKYDANTFFLLLGGVQAGKWLTPEQAASLIQGTYEYDIRPSDQDLFQVLGYAPESTPIRPGQYTIGSDATQDAFGMLGVAHGWPVRLGQVAELSHENEIYRQVVLDWLKEAGLSEPQLGDLHVFRVDLEGDGTDEIFISATHLDESQHTTRAGDYSIILMRKVSGDGAVTLPLVADVYRSQEAEITYPGIYSVANFIDLDQDGILEVIVDVQRWEGDGAIIYTIHGQEIAQVP